MRFERLWQTLSLLILLYLLALPFTRMTPVLGLPVRVAYADICYALVLIATMWMCQRSQWHGPKLLGYELIAIGFVGFLGLQTVIFHPSMRAASKVIGLLYLVSLPIVFRQAIREERLCQYVFRVIMGLASLLALAGVVMYAHSLYLQAPTIWVIRDQLTLEAGEFLLRLISVGYTPNMFAAFMHLGIVSGLWLVSSSSDRLRLLAWLSICLMGMNVMLCKSRLLLGAMVSVGIWLWWHRREMTRLARTLTSLLVIGTLTFGVLVGGSLVYMIAPVRWHMSNGVFVSWNQQPSPYLFLNVLAGTLFRQHPWTGIGLGHFRDYSSQSEAILQTHAPAFASRFPDDWLRTPRDPHSTYQGLAAEAGILGIVIWCLFLVCLVRFVTRRIAQTQEPTRRCQLVALFSGLVGFMVQGVYIDILSLRYFWCLVALTSVLISQTDEHCRRLSPS